MTETPSDVPQYVGALYEDVVSNLEKESIKEYKDLLFFPDDNIEVKRLKKENPSGIKVVPDKIEGSLSLATKEIFNVFTQDLCVVNHKYKEYTKVSLDDSKFKKQKFKIDKETSEEKKKEKETSEKDDKKKETKRVKVKMDLIKTTPQDARETYNTYSMKRLFKLFDMSVHSVEYNWAGGAEIQICKRFVEKKKMALKRDDPILIEIENFETDLCKKDGQIEPLFLSICLFDTHHRRKVSETFYFEFNKPNILELLNVKNPDPTTQIRNVVFKVSHRSPDIFLYIRILKVLQGDEEDAIEPYIKVSSKKISKQVGDYCSRLGAYRQAIAWAAVPMFAERTEDLRLPTCIDSFRRMKGNMNDATFCSLLEGTSQLKKFPAELKIKVTELMPYSPKYRDNQIVEIPSTESNAPPIIAKEMIEFPTIPKLEFNSFYVNYLYVCPSDLSLPSRGLQTKYSRNITVCVQVKENYDDLDAPGLPLIFGRDSTQPVLTDKQFTSVTYHNRHPEFGDEIKIMLPPVITPLHHLLFTFYHIQCKQKTGKANELVIGYAIVPLLQDDMIVHGPVRAKLLAEFPSRQPYSELDAKILDSGKKDFLINFRAVSTIYPNDKNIANFFRHFSVNVRSSMSQHTDPDLLLAQSIASLKNSPPEIIVQYLPVIFNQLLKTICGVFKQSKFAAFKVLLHLLDMVSSLSTTHSSRNELLMKYLNEYFTNFKDVKAYVFEELPQQWLIMLQESKQRRRRNLEESYRSTQESAENRYPLEYSWFLFDAIYKSMVLYLDDNKAFAKDRKKRFSKEFYSLLEKLVTIMADEIIYRSGVGLNLAKSLNSNLALFLRDLLNVMDRGFILTLIRKFLEITTVTKNFEVLQECRMTFLQIIVDYEHFIPMCLPVDYNITLGNIDKMTHDRFLAGILLEQCKADLINKERTVRARVLHLLRQVLTKLEYDVRYQSDDAKSRVATIFFPFVLIVIELFEKYKEVVESKLNRLRKEENDKNAKLNDIKNSIANKLESQDKKQMDEQHINKLKEEEERVRKNWEISKFQYEEEMKRVKQEYQSLLICLLYIIKNTHHELFQSWWRAAPKSDIAIFLNILHLCLEIFQYPGKEKIAEKERTGVGTLTMSSLSEAKSKLESMYTSLDKRTNLNRSGTSRSTLTRNFKIQRAAFNKSLTAEPSKIAVESKDIIKKMVLWEGNMSTEVSITVIEILHDFILYYKNELSEVESIKDEEIIRKRLFSFVEVLLADYQSEKALICAFTFLKIFIQEYESLIYSTGTDTPFLETLCNLLLAHCYSPYSEKVRMHSTSLLYILLKNDYLKNGNFSKTAIQTTLALSKLVPYVDQSGIDLLTSAFNAISQYATKDEVLPRDSQKKIQETVIRRKQSVKENFDFTKVQQLVERLRRTLLDTIEIKKLEETNADNEMRAELYLNIAKGYRHAPELSVTWYENLADHHIKNERWVEAAQCIIYIAAVSYQYLKLSNNPIASSLNYDYMIKVSPNLKNEQFEDLKLLFSDKEKPHFESNHFFESGFVRLINKAIEYFNNAHYFEYSVLLYKMLIDLYENRNFDELQKIHLQMSQLYGNIAKANIETTRLVGNFYKVGFYGKKFSEHLNGTEFIYKMSPVTKISDIKGYLENNFGKQFGPEKVKIIGDTYNIEGLTEQDEFAYIQITPVEPYNEIEVDDGITHLDKFIYETPSTSSDENKRTEIITVANPFPCLMTRIRIVKKEVK